MKPIVISPELRAADPAYAQMVDAFNNMVAIADTRAALLANANAEIARLERELRSLHYQLLGRAA
jgi:hypothetical protein